MNQNILFCMALINSDNNDLYFHQILKNTYIISKSNNDNKCVLNSFQTYKWFSTKIEVLIFLQIGVRIGTTSDLIGTTFCNNQIIFCTNLETL